MDEERMDLAERTADPVDVGQVAVEALYHEQYVQALWPEVASLPLKQRRAFLLHLEKDEVLVFVHHGCSSLRHLAEVLEIPPEEFVEWFGQLPLPDNRIAEWMEITRREIINLRKCARERLGRRLKVWAEE